MYKSKIILMQFKKLYYEEATEFLKTNETVSLSLAHSNNVRSILLNLKHKIDECNALLNGSDEELHIEEITKLVENSQNIFDQSTEIFGETRK